MKKLIPLCMFTVLVSAGLTAFAADKPAPQTLTMPEEVVLTPPAPAPEADPALISRVEDYLNDIKTFHAQFQQDSAAQGFAEGEFYLHRPAKFLWLYTKPDPMKIVSNGGLIYFEDGTTKQVTQVPRTGLAELLTRPTITLQENGVTVEDIHQDKGLVEVTLNLQVKDDGDEVATQQVRLGFTDGPLQLRRVTTLDQFEQPVVVSFYDIRQNTPLPGDVFDYTPPQYREN